MIVGGMGQHGTAARENVGPGRAPTADWQVRRLSLTSPYQQHNTDFQRTTPTYGLSRSLATLVLGRYLRYHDR